MANLHQEIEKLVEEYQKAYDKFMELRCKMYHYGYELDEDMYERYEHKLQEINDKYKIDCDKLAKIISKKKGEEYRFKVFREVELYNGEAYYTHEYTACYVNKNNKYFNTECDFYTGASLFEDDYKIMIKSLNDTNSMIASTSKGKRTLPPNPALYLNQMNFIKMFTRGTTNELELLEPEFKKQIKPIIKERLEQIDASEEQNNLVV